MVGYIALHRKIMENEFYFSEKFTKSQAWIDLLLLATHTEQTIFIRGIEIKLNPGELCYSQLSIAARWKWNFKTVCKFLKLLENRKMVETKTNKVTTIISIVNWREYQVLKNKNVYESLNRGEQNGEQRENKKETNNNVDNVNNVNNDKKDLPQKNAVSLSHSECIKIFDNYYLNQTGIKYTWDGKDIKQLQLLLQKVEKQIRLKTIIDPVKEQIIDAFTYLITNISNTWILNNLSIPNINSKFNELLNQIKNEKSINNSSESKFNRLNRESEAITKLIQRVSTH